MDTIFEDTQLIYCIKWFIIIVFLPTQLTQIYLLKLFLLEKSMFILQFLQYLSFRGLKIINILKRLDQNSC